MRAWLIWLSDRSIVLIDGVALLVILVGTAEVIVRGLMMTPFNRYSGHDARSIWIRYARWLVGALTLQLAADIIETAISTSWEAIGRVGLIAVIRTFLNYFLDRDLLEARTDNRTDSRPAPGPDVPTSPRD
jgi:uncharacterized membrane protein